MKILKLNDLRNKYEMRDAGYNKVVRTLSEGIIESPEAYINPQASELNLVLSDVRGGHVEVLIPFNQLVTLYRAIKDRTYNTDVYTVKEFKKTAKANAINIKVDETDLANVVKEKTKLLYPEFTNPTMLGEVQMQVNGDYVVLAKDGEFFLVHRINLIDSLVSVQSLLGLEQLELQSMSFELTNRARSMDADVITYGKSSILYSGDKLYVIQDNLMKHALLVRRIEPSRRKYKLFQVNEEEQNLYKGIAELEVDELSEQEYIVYQPTNKSLAPKVYVPIKTLISTGFTANKKLRTVKPMLTIIRITNRITRTVELDNYLSKDQLLKDEAYNQESKYLEMTGGM